MYLMLRSACSFSALDILSEAHKFLHDIFIIAAALLFFYFFSRVQQKQEQKISLEQ